MAEEVGSGGGWMARHGPLLLLLMALETTEEEQLLGLAQVDNSVGFWQFKLQMELSEFDAVAGRQGSSIRGGKRQFVGWRFQAFAKQRCNLQESNCKLWINISKVSVRRAKCCLMTLLGSVQDLSLIHI